MTSEWMATALMREWEVQSLPRSKERKVKPRTWICAFCLEAEEREDGDSPDRCTHCNIFSCRECGTFLKGGSTHCYGCGDIGPELRPRFVSSDSTAAVYMEQEWIERNCKPFGTKEYYFLSTGRDHKDPNRYSQWLVLRTAEGKYVTEHELTEEEKAIVNRMKSHGRPQ